MKDIAKRVLANAVLRLPLAAQQAIYEVLHTERGRGEENEEKELSRLARLIGITGLMAEGESGLIEGPSDDQTILPTYARSKTWAAGTNRLFIDLFKERGGTYIDVGANIGLTTIPIAANPHVSCYSFEPDPVLFFHLSENIRRNCKNSNVVAYQTALGASRGKVEFGVNPIGNRGDNRVVVGMPEDPTWRVIQVPIQPLDGVNMPGNLPLGVKIDTQGYEPFVVEGGASTLAKAALIVMEFWPITMSKLGGAYTKPLELISRFKCAAIMPAESDDEPNFEPPQIVCQQLANFAIQAGEKDYVDVVVKQSL